MSWNEITMASGRGQAGDGFPGPRDWSPAMDKAKRELKAFKTRIPQSMRVPMEEVRESEFPEIVALVENGLAIVLKIGIAYHLIFVSRTGKLRIDPTVQKILHK